MSSEPIPLNPLEFPLHGTRLIEASAGTGKTWTIAALYVRLILGHGDESTAFGRALWPPEILVVTFTEAATKELRDRIRKRLTEAARCFRGLGKPDGFLQGLIDSQGADGRSACARRLEVAAQWMDEAAVHTIHGWCNRMLRQHAFDSGSLFDLEIETQDTELLNEAVRDYWRSFFYPLDESASLAVAKFADSPKTLLAQIQGLLDETEAEWRDGEQLMDGQADPQALLAAWGGWEERRRELESQARMAWAGDSANIERWLREASAQGWLNGNSYRANTFEARLDAIAAWAQTGEACDPKWLEGFAQSRFKLNKKYQDKLLQHPAFAALDALADQQAQEPDIKREIFTHATLWVRQRFAQEKQRRARVDFADLLIHLDAALRRPGGQRLAEAIRKQYPVALVDEFQDTDPVQYRIFAAVYAEQVCPLPLCKRGTEGDSSAFVMQSSPKESPLTPLLQRGGSEEGAWGNPGKLGFFMIGDPKQAIYSFRGADIFTYLKAREATAGRHYTLDRNFRSSAAMVAAVNRFFGHAEGHANGAFKFKSEEGGNPLPFRPVEAQGRTGRWWVESSPHPNPSPAGRGAFLPSPSGRRAGDEGSYALTLWHLSAEDNGPVAMGKYRHAMAEAAASEIVRLLNLAVEGKAGFQSDNGFTSLKPADLAILVRDRGEAAAIRQALAARRVRSVYLSDRESVYVSAEAADLLHWLNACAEPERDRLLRAALGTATLDLGYAELEILNSDELRWEAEVERFRGYRKIWRWQGVLPLLRRMMADFNVSARLLQTVDGERRLTNLLHLAELLQTASVDLDGEQALIRHLAEACDSEGQAGDETLLRLESDADLIKVVTIHKSKGLEYPLVFLPFICSFREIGGAKLTYYRYHDAAGRLQVDLGKSEPARQQAELERLQEDLRLLYVALTRASHACWLGLRPVKSGNVKDCQLEKSAIGQVLNGGVAMQAQDLGGYLAQLKGDCAAIVIEPPPAPSDEAYVPPSATVDLQAARAVRGRATEHWWIASYSALRLETEDEAELPRTRMAEPPDTPRQANLEEAVDEIESPNLAPISGGAPTLHRFPRGAKPGTFLHGLLEWAAREGFGRVASEDGLREDTVARRCHTRGLMGWKKPLGDWLGRLLATPLALPEGSVALASLRNYQPELEFWFAADHVDTLALDRLVTRHVLPGQPRPALLRDRLNGMLKGFIDLVFEHDGSYYVADYKSNWLGVDDEAYTAEAMREAVLEKRYDLQYALYLLALHRLLKARLRGAYDYDRHIGGAVYLFLRGLAGPAGGLHLEKPPRMLIEALDALFAGQGGLADVA